MSPATARAVCVGGGTVAVTLAVLAVAIARLGPLAINDERSRLRFAR